MRYDPHPYQKEAIKFIIEHGAAAIFQDPGLGKTSETYAAFHLIKKAQIGIKKMLVIAPLRVALSSWPREAQKWDEFRNLRVAVLHGPMKDVYLQTDFDVYIINPEGLEWLFNSLINKPWPFEMLVVDESTKFKHPTTKRFKLLRKHLTKFKRRYILTGSPAPNGLMDLFGQIYILDLGNALGAYITHFRNEFFNATGFGGYTFVPKPTADKLIYDKIAPLTLRMAAKDYLDMPPLLYNDIRVTLPPEAWKVYKQMEQLMLAELANGEVVTAANAAAVSGKCRQIANGGIYTAAPLFEHVHEAKLEAVQDLVDELGGKPALIAYEYQHDLVRLQRAFPGAPHLGGGVTSRRQREIEDAWNSGQLPILLAQPQSVAHGLNLQGVGAAVIWHSLTWNLEDYEQLIRRIWRQGQRERVVVHHIVATGTVDEVIKSVVAKKDRTQQDLLGALHSYAQARRAKTSVEQPEPS